MNRIFIAGCGDVGTSLGRLLAEGGSEVLGMRRSPGEANLPFPMHSGDLLDPSAYPFGDPAFDAAVYIAAADSRSEESYQRAYVDALKSTISFLRETSPNLKRFLFVSSTGVYAQNDGEWLDESSEAIAERFTGRVLLEAEAEAQRSGFETTVVRFGGIYGPGRTYLLNAVRDGRLQIVENAARYTNRIHRDDCAGMLAHLLCAGELESIYLGVDNEPVDASEVYRWLAAQMNVKEPTSVRWSSEQLRDQGQGKRCRNTRIQESGYTFRYPSYREGYRAVLSGMGFSE